MIVLVAQEKECHSFVVACELFACQNRLSAVSTHIRA